MIDETMRDALLPEFRRITLERIERIDACWRMMERATTDDVTSELFRELHTMKGEAMLLGAREISAVAQRMEELALSAKARDFRVGPQLGLAITAGTAAIRGLVASSGEPDDEARSQLRAFEELVERSLSET